MNGDDVRALELLKVIRQLAALFYPYSEDSDVSPLKAFALGEIAGIASRAISGHKPKP